MWTRLAPVAIAVGALLGCGAKSGLSVGERVGLDAGRRDAGREDSGRPDASSRACTRMAELSFQTSEPSSVLLVLDASSSMETPFGGGLSRWDAVTEALIGEDGVITRLGHRVSLGVVRYTSIALCPIVESLAAGLDGRAAITALLEAPPGGSTPTGETLRQVRAELGSLTDPSRPTSLVLATDGEPISCGSTVAPEAAQRLVLEQVGLLSADGVPTFVLSVGSELSEAHLQDIANRGAGRGPGEPDVPAWRADDPAGLTDLLAAAVGAAASCVAALPWRVTGPCGGEVELGGAALSCQTPDGFRMEGDRVRFSGAACESWESGATALVRAPCD